MANSKFPSWPGLTGPSTPFDRAKKAWMAGSSPAMTGVGALVIAVGLLTTAPAQAQMSNMMQGMMGSGGSSGAMGNLGGMSMPSVGAASPNNLAGLLQFCVQNNYLGGTDASSVKSSLLSKFGGSSQPPEQNSGFSSGAAGILDTGNGQTATLGGSGIKAQVTKKVCDMVLQHAQSQL